MNESAGLKADIRRIVIERRDAEGKYLGTIEVDADGTVKHIAAGEMTEGQLLPGAFYAVD